MKKISAKEIMGKVVDFFDTDKTKVHFYPQRDWYVLFTVVVLLIVGLVIANLSLLSLIDEEKIFFVEKTEEVSSEVINLRSYKATTALFEAKKDAFDELQKNRPVIIDPSL